MNKDKDGEVINGNGTYRAVADELAECGRVLLGWNDQSYTHFDILIALNPPIQGMTQGGRSHCELSVAIYGVGCAAFRLDTESSVGYVAEKLFNRREGEDVEAVAELISGIKRRLNKINHYLECAEALKG